MIRRHNFAFDYLDPAAMAAVGASQVVIAGGLAHWSGIVAARHTAGGTEFPARTMREQLAFVLDRIDACLQGVGTDRSRIVALTMFCTDVDELSAAIPEVFAPWAGDDRPTLTVIGVSRLTWSELRLEIQGCAAMPA